MAYLVRIQRQRAQSTTRGWQVRVYWDNPRYVSRFFAAADHGGLRVPKPARGSQQGGSKLTEQDALAIKHSTERTGALVERYRVSRTTVKQIRNGSIWRHIP